MLLLTFILLASTHALPQHPTPILSSSTPWLTLRPTLNCPNGETPTSESGVVQSRTAMLYACVKPGSTPSVMTPGVVAGAPAPGVVVGSTPGVVASMTPGVVAPAPSSPPAAAPVSSGNSPPAAPSSAKPSSIVIPTFTFTPLPSSSPTPPPPKPSPTPNLHLSDESAPGDVWMCTGTNFSQKCIYFRTTQYKCHNLPADMAGLISSIRPDKHQLCRFFDDDDCMGRSDWIRHPGTKNMRGRRFDNRVRSWSCADDACEGVQGEGGCHENKDGTPRVGGRLFGREVFGGNGNGTVV